MNQRRKNGKCGHGCWSDSLGYVCLGLPRTERRGKFSRFRIQNTDRCEKSRRLLLTIEDVRTGFVGVNTRNTKIPLLDSRFFPCDTLYYVTLHLNIPVTMLRYHP
jgi:hypothetical protein